MKYKLNDRLFKKLQRMVKYLVEVSKINGDNLPYYMAQAYYHNNCVESSNWKRLLSHANLYYKINKNGYVKNSIDID